MHEGDLFQEKLGHTMSVSVLKAYSIVTWYRTRILAGDMKNHRSNFAELNQR